MPRDDPVNEASSPPGGAVHQAQEPRELLGVQWPQVTRTRVQSQFRTGKAWWSVPIPGAQDAARVKLPARGRAHSCSGMQWLSAAGVTTDARPQVRRSTSQWASPDKVAVGHAVGRGLLVEICHLLLVQFVHVHLHVCTKRKAVRGQGRVRGLGRRGRAPGDGGTGGGDAHQTGSLCRQRTSRLIAASPGWHGAWPEASTTKGKGRWGEEVQWMRAQMSTGMDGGDQCAEQCMMCGWGQTGGG